MMDRSAAAARSAVLLWAAVACVLAGLAALSLRTTEAHYVGYGAAVADFVVVALYRRETSRDLFARTERARPNARVAVGLLLAGFAVLTVHVTALAIGAATR
jgi:predicted lysophospholipase L1 biosynthesis ABC-type transport system permease subunit